MKPIKLNRGHKLRSVTVPVPGSKSESNRALIINALCPEPGEIANLAIARDTDILQELLAANQREYNARDAGTVMRFMTAYLSVSAENAIITGTARMQKRPIGILVEALRELGVQISYLGEEGYPPLKIEQLASQATNTLTISSEVSSQYISALLMVAPVLPQGLTLNLAGEPVSTPYIDMTVSIMQHFGVKVDVSGRSYYVAPQTYTYRPYAVESDWSGASYWYAIFALSNLPELQLRGLKANSYQGDSVLAPMMERFGVQTTFTTEGATLSRTAPDYPQNLDFINCPDLAQTFAVLCAALRQPCVFTGLQTLKIKETDRVKALATELQKLGADFVEEHDQWRVVPVPAAAWSSLGEVAINTYEDHRMAMAFAALATKIDVSFDDRDVVNKSYPTFWQDLQMVGFSVAR